MKKLNALARFSVALLAICCLAITAAAQIQNGQLTGSVTDPSGAAVPNAKVTATNPNTSFTNTANTNDGGVFTVRELPIGTYKLTVEATGFKTSTKSGIEVNAGVTYRLDFKLEVGGATEVIEVTEEAAPVNTVDSKLANTVGSTQIQNLPLNGRNVYSLMLLAPGAVDVNSVLTENGENAVVNGTRLNFNGFLINGSSNKGLSGGAVNRPIEDTVAEFQLLTLNNSAQYGNSAGSVTNLVTKSGTNNYHGSVWWFVRNDVFDANSFFNNKVGEEKPALRFNQFGGTFGGPIMKDKLFFFGSYQGNRFRTFNLPVPVVVETPEFQTAAVAAFPNSVAALLFNNFDPLSALSNPDSFNDVHVVGEDGVLGTSDDTAYFGLCPDFSGSPTVSANLATLIGITAQDIAILGCPTALAVTPGTLNRALPFLASSLNIAPSRRQENLFDGNELSLRLDYNIRESDRIFAQFNWSRQNDNLPGTTGGRGFTNPTRFIAPNGQFNWIHTFSPSFLNEFRAGYVGSYSKYVPTVPGVPSIYLVDGTMGFGSYSGYPQFFKEHIYTYADMVSITKGNHNLKLGFDARRNIENSEFNVGRPSYYFFDPLFFAVDAPYAMSAGVNPEFASGNPAHLATNIRHWRNWEFGAYFQDDWKITRNLTLNLGLRYDLYVRHNELNDLATTFLMGPGSDIIDDITTGAGGMRDANIPVGAPGCDTAAQRLPSVLAGVCGPGGFATTSQLGGGDTNNFGPRIGFAWDVFGNGKTSLRGGAGVSYEGTLYNPLSNSRWNPPYYSFNQAFNDLAFGTGVNVGAVPYGPQTGGGCPNCVTTPTFTGPPDPLNFQGSPGDATAEGNIMAWNPNTTHQAVLTGIVLPEGIRDPYVYNWFFGLQRELAPKWVVELNYVGTAGHKLFRAEDINRIPGGRLPEGTCTTDIFGRNLCSQLDSTIGAFGDPINASGRLNPNYGRMRNWRNVVNSNYHSLQASLRKQMSKGFQFQLTYTWSHAIDGGSTWHSGATSSNGAAGGEGFTTDQTLPSLDRGNSIYDIRHRIGFNYVYELPFFKGRGGVTEAILGGWQINGIMSFQTGAHWNPFCSSLSRCDFNRDRVANERPDSILPSFNAATHDMWANGWGATFACSNPNAGCGAGDVFSAPAAGSPGNLGRNTFVGPNFWGWDPSVFKNFKITERVGLQFRAEFFNMFNRTNFKLPGAEGAGQNEIRRAAFGQAGGTFNPRNLQFGLKLTF
ncbi:MAG: TonB-dependent receptor domain-containing protein [Terriglobales bacterium]